LITLLICNDYNYLADKCFFILYKCRGYYPRPFNIRCGVVKRAIVLVR